MTELIPPNPAALAEALELSEQILADIELARIPLSHIALKASCLARLINDQDHQLAFSFEAGGYPMESGYVSPEAWRLALISGRRWSEFDSKTNDRKEFAYVESISQLEDQLDVAKRSFDACGSQKPDPNISAVEEWVEGHRARTRRAAVGGNDATRIQTRDQVVMNPASLIR